MSDTGLLSGLKREPGNTQFREIVNTWGAMVYNVCYRVLQEKEAARDAAETVFFILAENPGIVRSGEGIACRLHSIAVAVSRKLMKDVPVRNRDTVKGKEDWSRISKYIDIEINDLSHGGRKDIIEGFIRPDTALSQESDIQPDASVISRRNRSLETVRERLAQKGVVLSLGNLANLISSYSEAEPLPDNFLQKAEAGTLSRELLGISRSIVRAQLNAKIRFTAGGILIAGIAVLIIVKGFFSGRPDTGIDRGEDSGKPEIFRAEAALQVGETLSWREIGTPPFYRNYRPLGIAMQDQTRFGAWWSDYDYMQGLEEQPGASDHTPGKPMTDFDRFMIVGVCRKIGDRHGTMSVSGVTETEDHIVVAYTLIIDDIPGGGKTADSYLQFLLEVDRRNKPVIFVENGKTVGEVLPCRKIALPDGVMPESDQPVHTVCRSVQDCVSHIPLKKSGDAVKSGKLWPGLDVVFKREMVIAAYFGAVTRPADYSVTQLAVFKEKLYVYLEFSFGGDSPYPGTLAACPRRDMPVVWYVDGEFLKEDPVSDSGSAGSEAETAKEKLPEPLRQAEITVPASTGAAEGRSEWGIPVHGLQIKCEADTYKWKAGTSSVRITAHIKNVSEKEIRVIDWSLFPEGVKIEKESGREVRCMQFARARYSASEKHFPVLKPGEIREFTVEGKFGPSRSEGWFSLTLPGLTGITRRWSLSNGTVRLRAVLENSPEKDWLSYASGTLKRTENDWSGRVESNVITITVGTGE